MPNYEISEHVTLKSGSQIENLKGGVNIGDAIIGVIKYVSANKDYQFYNGTKWVSMSGFKSANKNDDAADTFGLLEGLSTDGATYEFRSIKKGSSKITMSNTGGIITIDLGTVAISDITDLQDALDDKVDKVAGKELSTEDFTTSLKDKLSSIKIVKKATPNTDQSATYELQATVGGITQTLGTSIDIPKDMVIQSGTVGTVTTANQPYTGAVVGEKYIDLLLANSADTHIYIPAKSLVDIYKGGETTEIIVTVNDTTNVITASINDSSIKLTKLANITLGTIAASSTQVVTTATGPLTILQTFAKNIKYLFTKKADDDTVITAPSASDTQNAAGTFKIKAILQILINNVKALFDNKAENKQTMAAPTASDTQQGAGSFTIVSILQTLMNNIKHLFDNKADNKQTIGTTTASETQVGTGSLTILSILQTFAKNIKALFAWKTTLNLQKTYVSPPLTGQSGSITAVTHGVTNPKVVIPTKDGSNLIIYTKIDATTKNVTWTSQTNFVAGDNVVLTIIG